MEDELLVILDTTLSSFCWQRRGLPAATSPVDCRSWLNSRQQALPETWVETQLENYSRVWEPTNWPQRGTKPGPPGCSGFALLKSKGGGGVSRPGCLQKSI